MRKFGMLVLFIAIILMAIGPAPTALAQEEECSIVLEDGQPVYSGTNCTWEFLQAYWNAHPNEPFPVPAEGQEPVVAPQAATPTPESMITPETPQDMGEEEQGPLGDVSDWRVAGSDSGCPGFENMTTAYVQEAFDVGVGVFRIANYQCVWGANGAPQLLTFADTQFEVYDIETETLYTEPGNVTAGNFLIVHKASHPQFDYAAYVAAQNESCERLPEMNAQTLSEMISGEAPEGQEALYQPIRLAKNAKEECGFYVRNGRFATHVPDANEVDYVIEFTIHPYGDDEVHEGDPEDEAFVLYNDLTPDMTLDVYAMTVRVVQRVSDGRQGFNPLDAVHDKCRLWWHEYANGLIEEAPFGVYPLGYSCPYDRDYVQNVLTEELNRPDVTAPEVPTLYGVSFEGSVINREGMQEVEEEAPTATPFPADGQ